MKCWIARNKDNTLAIFQSKPYLNTIQVWDEHWNEDYMYIPDYYFPEVTFDNSPQEVELKLVEK